MSKRQMTSKQPVPTHNLCLKFCGTLEQVKKLTWDAGVCGTWRPRDNGNWEFRLRNGAVMNWSSTKGTIWFGGPAPAQAELARRIQAAIHQWVYPVKPFGESSIRASAQRKRRPQQPRRVLREI